MPRKGTKKRAARWVAWTPAMAELFRLSTAIGWKAPAKVRLTPGAERMTLSARFTDEDGQAMTARIRLRRDHAVGGWSAGGEELSIRVGQISGGGANDQTNRGENNA